jgi:glutamine synthetase
MSTSAFDNLITTDELIELTERGEIDTVLVVFPDMQGRLVGKRVVARFFVDELSHNGGTVEACTYLLAVDVEMDVLPGFRFANWDTGYGDMACRPDLSTLRRVPWLDATAMVLCDLFHPDGSPVEESPRRILRRQIERAANAGFTVKAGTELEFFLSEDTYQQAAAKHYRDLTRSGDYILDYHLLQTTKDEWFLRDVRNAMYDAGIPVEFSKGEAGVGQHELNIRYDEALRCADHHVIYKNGIKEMAALSGVSVTFMAKPDIGDAGSSCHIHSSIWDTAGERSLTAGDGAHGFSPEFAGWVGGIAATAAELCWLGAPYLNSYRRYQPGSWAPTGIGWGVDNRTLGLRIVGHGQGLRVENRIPGADCNPYLAVAGVIAGGLHGIESGLDAGEPYVGNGYEATDVDRIPHTLPDAIEAFRHSAVARNAFGEEVHWHLVHMAEAEWTAFNRTVTDWELRRGYEQL